MDIRMPTHDSDVRFVVGKLTTLITHPLNIWVIEKHEHIFLTAIKSSVFIAVHHN